MFTLLANLSQLLIPVMQCFILRAQLIVCAAHLCFQAQYFSTESQFGTGHTIIMHDRRRPHSARQTSTVVLQLVLLLHQPLPCG
jgi:hypothetical protein